MNKKMVLRPLDAAMNDSYSTAELYAVFESQVFSKAKSMDVSLLNETVRAIDDRDDEEAVLHAAFVWQKIQDRIESLQRPFALGLSRKGFAILVIILLIILTTSALAAILIPGIRAWINQNVEWVKPESIGSVQIKEGDLASFKAGGVHFTCLEAMADYTMFWANIRIDHLAGALIKPFDGQNIPHIESGTGETNNTPIIYVHCDVQYQGHTNEVIDYQFDDDGNMYCLCTGMCDPDSQDQDTMGLTCYVLMDGIIDTNTASFSLSPLPTLENWELSEPIHLGDTGIILQSLRLHRTAFRTYIDWEYMKKNMPLETALKQPTVELMDENGQPLNRWWNYDDGIPEKILIRVVAQNETEVLFETILMKDQFIIKEGQ